MTRQLLVLVVIIAQALIACGNPRLPTLGGYDVTVRNDTLSTVHLYLDAPDVPPTAAVAKGVAISPGASFVDHWQVPSGSDDQRVATLRAKDDGGTLVYCHKLTWNELKSAGFLLKITSARDCE